MTVLTLRIDDKMDAALNEWAQKSGRTKSDLARDALRAQLFALWLEGVRQELVPATQAAGVLTDEDVFDMVS